MMSVLEYALDVNKTVEEIFDLCKRLNIDVVEEDDLLDEDAIVELDNEISSIGDSSEEVEIVEEDDEEDVNIIVDNVKVTDETLVTKQKLKKKNDVVKSASMVTQLTEITH